MTARLTATFSAALLMSGHALADISFDYAELNWGIVGIDVAEPADGDGDGPGAFLSHGLFGPVFGFAGYSYTDFSDDNVRFDDLEVGLGAHHALSEDTSAFVRVSYLRTDVESPASKFDQDGYGVSVGVRVENHTPWEFVGEIDYVNVESGVEVGGGIALVYDATRRFSVTGGFDYFESSTSGFLGFRYFFDIHH